LDTLWLPQPYHSLNWERLAHHSDFATMNLRSSRAIKALGSFTLGQLGHLGHLGHLGLPSHLGHLGLPGHLGYLSTMVADQTNKSDT
jgi:hypothetical protein